MKGSREELQSYKDMAEELLQQATERQGNIWRTSYYIFWWFRSKNFEFLKDLDHTHDPHVPKMSPSIWTSEQEKYVLIPFNMLMLFDVCFPTSRVVQPSL